MSKLSVALQIYSVRDFAEKDLTGTLQKVKEMGYDSVELAGLYGHSVGSFRAALNEAGLTALSAHVPFFEMEADTAGTVLHYKQLGCRYMAIPWLSEDYCPGGSKFDTTLRVINEVGRLCVENGMTLLYHNHDFEFKKLPDGTFALDYLYQQVPANILQTELDTCWVKVAGQDPAAYVLKYAGRSPVVHLKDFYKEGAPVRPYELIGADDKAEAPRGVFEFRPVGHGMQDFPLILKASEEAGASWVVVEQDMSVGRTSLEAAEMSREYLRSQGY
jgi:sugar phosphate isomerase/epimerase